MSALFAGLALLATSPFAQASDQVMAARLGSADQPAYSLAFLALDGPRLWLVVVSDSSKVPENPPELRASKWPALEFQGPPVVQGAGDRSLVLYPVKLLSTPPNPLGLPFGQPAQGNAFVRLWNRAKGHAEYQAARVDSGQIILSTIRDPIDCIGAPVMIANGVVGVIVAPTRHPRTWHLAPLEIPKTARPTELVLAGARHTLPVLPLDKKNARVPLSADPDRPCVTIHGVTGNVVFQGRKRSQDKAFTLSDPTYRKAVRERTLDQLIGQPTYVRYTAQGTLTIPVKIVDFPLLGQDQTGTCWVAHYREWLYYYLGNRHERVPALEDLQTYLNLLHDPVTLRTLFSPKRSLAATSFAGSGQRARQGSDQMRQNLTQVFGLLLHGETVSAEQAAIDSNFQGKRFSSRSRAMSEAAFGAMMESLLLGDMVLGHSESHVMNILGFEDDRVMISTWAREYVGTLRQLAEMDRRGPLLAPIDYEIYSMVARDAQGRVVIPPLVARADDALDAPHLKLLERFNRPQ